PGSGPGSGPGGGTDSRTSSVPGRGLASGPAGAPQEASPGVPSRPKPAGNPHRRPIALLWAATLLAYASSFQAGLIFDNGSRILNDPRIQQATGANVDLILKTDYWHPNLGSGIYRPLTTLSFLFNYAVLGNGPRPFGYHAINWILHALNASLLYLLALRLSHDRIAAVTL